MKLAVIVPVYKVEPYLRQCIESILSQSYEDLKVILVDDARPIAAERFVMNMQRVILVSSPCISRMAGRVRRVTLLYSILTTVLWSPS